MWKTVTALLLIFLSAPARAQDWERTDTLMLAGAITLSVIDWGQTRDMVKRPASENFHENNPLLPTHPTISEVNRAAVLGIASTAALSYVLPQTYRRWFLGAVIVIETGVVARNHEIGLRVSF